MTSGGKSPEFDPKNSSNPYLTSKGCWSTGNSCEKSKDYPVCEAKIAEGRPYKTPEFSGFSLEPVPDGYDIYEKGWKAPKGGTLGVCRSEYKKDYGNFKDYAYFFFSSSVNAPEYTNIIDGASNTATIDRNGQPQTNQSKSQAAQKLSLLANSLAITNELAPTDNAFFYEIVGIELTGTQMASLIKMLKIPASNFKCLPGMCPSTLNEVGTYIFANNVPLFKKLLSKLTDTKPCYWPPKGDEDEIDEKLAKATETLNKKEIEGFDNATKTQLFTHLYSIFKYANMQNEKTDESMDQHSETSYWSILFMALGTAQMSVFLSSVTGPQIAGWWKLWRNKAIKYTDLGKKIESKLTKYPNFEVVGRMEQAREAWETIGPAKHKGMLIYGETGAGKDMLALAMGVLLKSGDDSVPEHFKNANLYQIDIADFIGGTKWRGEVGLRIKQIAKWGKMGPIIIHISEIDLLFSFGGTSDGNAENAGGLFLNLFNNEEIKKNLCIIGTTSRKITRKDLHRRFNSDAVTVNTLAEVVKIIDTGPTKTEFQADNKVIISTDVVEASAKLAEYYFRPSTFEHLDGESFMLPRFDCVEKVIAQAITIANREAKKMKKEGKKVPKEIKITIDHVIEAASKLSKISIQNPLDVIAMDFNDIDAEELTGEEFGAEIRPETLVKDMKTQPFFKALFRTVKTHRVKRIAEVAIMIWNTLTTDDRKNELIKPGQHLIAEAIPASKIMQADTEIKIASSKSTTSIATPKKIYNEMYKTYNWFSDCSIWRREEIVWTIAEALEYEFIKNNENIFIKDEGKLTAFGVSKILEMKGFKQDTMEPHNLSVKGKGKRVKDQKKEEAEFKELIKTAAKKLTKGKKK